MVQTPQTRKPDSEVHRMSNYRSKNSQVGLSELDQRVVSFARQHGDDVQPTARDIDQTTQHVSLEEMWFGEERDKRTRGPYQTDVFGTGAFSVFGPKVEHLSAPKKQYETSVSRNEDRMARETEARSKSAAKTAQLLRYGLAYKSRQGLTPILATPHVGLMEQRRRKSIAKRLIDEYEYEPSFSGDDEEDYSDALGSSKWEGRLPALQQALATLEQPPQSKKDAVGAISPHKGGISRDVTERLEVPSTRRLGQRKRDHLSVQPHDSLSPAATSPSTTPDTSVDRQQHRRSDFGLSFFEALDIAMAEERIEQGPRRQSNVDITTEQDGLVPQAPRPQKRRRLRGPINGVTNSPRTPLRRSWIYAEPPYNAIERYMAKVYRVRFEGNELAAAFNDLMQRAHPGTPVRSAESLMRQTEGKTF